MAAGRQKEERMWELAYRMARSGEYRNWLAIEWELRVMGHSRAYSLLDREGARDKLDRVCAEPHSGKGI